MVPVLKGVQLDRRGKCRIAGLCQCHYFHTQPLDKHVCLRRFLKGTEVLSTSLVGCIDPRPSNGRQPKNAHDFVAAKPLLTLLRHKLPMSCPVI